MPELEMTDYLMLALMAETPGLSREALAEAFGREIEAATARVLRRIEARDGNPFGGHGTSAEKTAAEGREIGGCCHVPINTASAAGAPSEGRGEASCLEPVEVSDGDGST